MSAEAIFALVVFIAFLALSLLVLGFMLLLIKTDDRVAKFFSYDPDVNEFEELKKNGK